MNKEELIAELRHNKNLGLTSTIYLTRTDYNELFDSLGVDDYYFDDNDIQQGFHWYVLDQIVSVYTGYRIDESWVSGVKE